MVSTSEAEQKQFGELIVPCRKERLLTLTAEEAVQSRLTTGCRLPRELVGGLWTHSSRREGLTGCGSGGRAVRRSPNGDPDDRSAQKSGQWSESRQRRKEQERTWLAKSRKRALKERSSILEVGQSTTSMNKQSFKFWRRMMRRAEDEKARSGHFRSQHPGWLGLRNERDLMTETHADQGAHLSPL